MRDMNSVAPADAASANAQKSKSTTQALPTSLTNGEPNYIFKIVIIGDTSVGKSSLLRSYISGEFDEKQTHTIGVEFASRVIDVEGEDVKLQLWDTAGQERFKAMTKSYYRGAAGCILVYDITRRETFLNIRNWVQEFRNHSGSPDAVMMVVGNKCDVVEARQVQFEEGVEFAKEFGIVFCEASAKK
ncbi:ras family-domain-containing protein [Paraphysoderma sedebokerense]|nr:ras family-domain-containing protein [Paraphysoderma sedebokerense]